MCKTKMAADASEPQPISSRTQRTRPSHSPRTHSSSRDQIPPIPSTSNPTSEVYASSSSNTKATSSGTGTSISSRTSLSSLRESISESPHIYQISEIRAATNNFLAKRYSSSSSSASTAACWRCNLRGRDTVVFQRKFRRKIQTSELRERLPVICRSHHMSIIKLLGASISGDHIYLVYEFIEGSNLSECLRNPRNPSFTVLSTWFSRMQIVTDLAHGLDYVHNQTGLNLSIVHNHIKSSSIIVTEASFSAKLCHFGTAQLCGETEEDKAPEIDTSKMRETEIEEVTEEGNDAILSKSKRSDSGERQFEGVRGYMSPEFRSSGVATQKSDIYAFGVVILELFSGEEPFKYRYDKNTGNFLRTSVIDTAAEAVANGSEGLRRWIDKRLNDSFPVEVAEKLMRLALDCVHVDPDKRPDMGRVTGKISKLYLESKTWTDNVKVPTGISVSWAPR